MRSDVIEALTGTDTVRIAQLFLGPLAIGIVQDFIAANRSESDAIIFTLSLLDSDVVAHSNDKEIFSEGSQTHLAIRAACEQAMRFHTTYGLSLIDAVTLSRHICRHIVSREGFMGNVVYETMRDAFGPHCHNHIFAFWHHLGMEVDSTGLFPKPLK